MTYQRYDAIQDIMKAVTDQLVVCNIGSPCKELYEINDRKENFYMLGSMGLASSIGLGVAMSAKDKRVVVIEGDGGILMNLGSLVTIANVNPRNLALVVIDNGSYGSTGFQKTFTHEFYGKTDIRELAKAAGISNSYCIDGRRHLDVSKAIEEILSETELSVTVIRTEEGQPKTKLIPLSSIDLKQRFMENF